MSSSVTLFPILKYSLHSFRIVLNISMLSKIQSRLLFGRCFYGQSLYTSFAIREDWPYSAFFICCRDVAEKIL